MAVKSPQSVQRCQRICEQRLGISLPLLLLEDKYYYPSPKFLFHFLVSSSGSDFVCHTYQRTQQTYIAMHFILVYIRNRHKYKHNLANLILLFHNCHFITENGGGLRFSMQLKPFRPLLRVKSVSAACPSNLIVFLLEEGRENCSETYL
jgi:hypothetical protein